MDEAEKAKAGRGLGSRIGNVVCFLAALPVGYGIAMEAYMPMIGGLVVLAVYAAVTSRGGGGA